MEENDEALRELGRRIDRHTDRQIARNLEQSERHIEHLELLLKAQQRSHRDTLINMLLAVSVIGLAGLAALMFQDLRVLTEAVQ